MKLLLIGDVKSGKTSFINSFFNQSSNSYEHTSCLEIKKSRYSLSSTKDIQFEFFDTNTLILNNDIISTYINISDGFVFVCDVSKKESIDYIDSKIEKVLNNCKNKDNPRFFFYINNTSTDETAIKSHLQLLEKISKKYSFSYNYTIGNLKEYCPKEDSMFKHFAELL